MVDRFVARASESERAEFGARGKRKDKRGTEIVGLSFLAWNNTTGGDRDKKAFLRFCGWVGRKKGDECDDQ